jgi:glycosyltransferase involved in cell wall biosynthesis
VLAYLADKGWDAEILVVNDGSHDNTAEIIRGFTERNPGCSCWRTPATAALRIQRAKRHAARAG